jgi:formylglycine-generating enzyme required for sulfatase activity
MTDTVSNRSLATVTLVAIFAVASVACTPATTITPGPTNIPEPTAPPTGVRPTADPSLDIGSTQVSNRDGMTLFFVPAGEFIMGNKEGDSSEIPEHSVYLDAFWIDQTEVTNAMYAKCVTADACQAPASTRSYTRESYYGNAEFDNYPVVYIAWNDAKLYCKWAGGDLPTEAQWEKAARGTDGNIYPWGNAAPDKTRLNYSQGVGDTTQVESYPTGASPYGALDMAGNLWEWVADWNGSYPSVPSRNPTGPTSGTIHMIRGGSWGSAVFSARTSARGGSPGDGNFYIGFRCARGTAP